MIAVMIADMNKHRRLRWSGHAAHVSNNRLPVSYLLSPSAMPNTEHRNKDTYPTLVYKELRFASNIQGPQLICEDQKLI